MNRPFPLSKTQSPCDCHWLDRTADNPDIPVVFDSVVGEFQIAFGHGGLGRAIIRHCPNCGGLAPASKRERLFARVEQEEVRRLHDRVKALKTVEQIREALGPPDKDNGMGATLGTDDFFDSRPGKIETLRELKYTGLSDTANIHFMISHSDEVRGVSFQSKYLGPPAV